MAKVIKVTVGGEERAAVEVAFEIKKENWNEYELVDGGTVRIRLNVHRMLRVLDAAGQPARTPDGDPFVVIQSQNSVVVSD